MSAVLEEAQIENSPKTVADIMRRMFEIRSERSEIKDRDSELFQEFERLSEQLIAKMEEQGSTRVSCKGLGTAILAKTIVPGVDDWDAVFQFIKDNDAFHLVQRRIATGAFREMLSAGQEVPGIRQVEKVDIGLRSE